MREEVACLSSHILCACMTLREIGEGKKREEEREVGTGMKKREREKWGCGGRREIERGRERSGDGRKERVKYRVRKRENTNM